MLGALPCGPRVVAGGNFATPWQALSVLDAAVTTYQLFMLNAQPGVLDRDGVIHESSFVGLVQTSVPANGTVSLGTEVNVLPAAIETARARGGLVIAQLNTQMPYTYGGSVLEVDDIDYAIEPMYRYHHRRNVRSGTARRPSAIGWRHSSPMTRRCSSASARSPTPFCPPSAAGTA